jgi:hypothetical protein
MMKVIPRVQRHRVQVRIPREIPWKRGRETQVPNDLGALLIARGWADEVKPKRTERAVRVPPETRDEPKPQTGVRRRIT